ncbi:MAG: CBS domain-containing protein [Candidatus Omnitrophica bacterium]|nr:CBS domain-containing protein [Candidatus Omnitrophota bacterium]
MHLERILIKNIMVTNVITIGIDEPFSHVWDVLKPSKIRHLPVVDTQGKLKGIITLRDLYRIVSPRKEVEEEGLFYLKEDLEKFILSNVMTENVLTLSADQTLGQALDLMVKKKFGCIPIVDEEGVLIGILTQIDVLRAIAKYFI